MVPATVVCLPALPRLGNGKVDRQGLPAPTPDRPDLGAVYVQPRTPMEDVLAEIWSEVLGVTPIGVHDNFFDLGGHSLSATRVVSHVRDRVGIELPLRAVFEAPTLEALAALLDLHWTGAAMSQRITQVGRDGDLPLSFSQERLWVVDQMETRSAAYHVPTALRLTGDLNIAALESSFSEIVRRHEVLRTTFTMRGTAPVQTIAPAMPMRLLVETLARRADEDEATAVERVIQEAIARPFNLRTGPLLCVRLWRLASDRHVLAIVMHHIVSDAWSAWVLRRELWTLYDAYRRGERSPLPELPLQYADYAVWQRTRAQDPAFARQLMYWTTQLAGAPAVLELPADRPRPATRSGRGGWVPFTMPASVVTPLKALARQERATLFMTLLAGFATLLCRHTGQEDIVIGALSAGRTRAEVEALIGFFVNTLVLRTSLAGDPSVRELLARVRETTLAVYAHQEVPFERLVAELQPERDLRYTPLCQVMCVMQNAPQTAWKLAGLQIETLTRTRTAAKFDLMLSLRRPADPQAGVASLHQAQRERHHDLVVGALARHLDQRERDVYPDHRHVTGPE